MFRGSDSPLYIKGFTATMSLYGVCLALATSITGIYAWSNRAEKGDAKEVEGEDHFRYPT